MSNLRVIESEGADLATVDQQLEQHAQNIERIQREAVYEIGREFSAIQDLHRYQRNGDGFTDYVSKRFPSLPQRSIYRAIQIFQGLDGELFAETANISSYALAEIAKSEPDVQSLIAEKIEAGEVFTAASVKELKATIKNLEAKLNTESDGRLAETKNTIEKLRGDLASKEAELKAANDGRRDDLLKGEITKPLNDEIAALRARVKELENDPIIEELRQQVQAAASAPASSSKSGRVNPHYQKNEAYDALQKIAGPAAQIAAKSKSTKIAFILTGFHDDDHRARVLDELRVCRDFLTKIIGQANDQ